MQVERQTSKREARISWPGGGLDIFFMEHSLQGIRVKMKFSHQFNKIWFGGAFLAFIGDSYLRTSDIFGLWESNLPMYFLPSVHVFPYIIHQCCANYDPVSKAVMTPYQTVLFYITAKSINEMLHFHPTQPLTPLSMGFLLFLVG